MSGSVENEGCINTAGKSGAKQLGERAADQIFHGAVALWKKLQGKISVALGTAFQRYLDNTICRYNQIQTIATGTDVHSLIGEDSIYVNTDLALGEQTISHYTVHSLIKIRNNLLIEGTGGIGKSMLMRYLFLQAAEDREYVPVMLELRKISGQKQGRISVLDLIYQCMEAFDVNLPKEQFEASLREGLYVFLFDGLDEVKDAYMMETAAAIQGFASKYPENPCIVTTRPMCGSLPLETFARLEAQPLTKAQAIELAEKLGDQGEKAVEFRRQLEESLFEKHRSFAENPLLLSMMYLTFRRNNSIPDHLADFYKKSFDALYSLHDSGKEAFRREFYCKNLEEQSFKQLFAYFCFHSYMQEEHEFTREKLTCYLDLGREKLALKEVEPQNYIRDLQSSVCMLVEEGDIYRFSHRSFQAYFAARYTIPLPDDAQQKLFHSMLHSWVLFATMRDYFELLDQMDRIRFEQNMLEDGVKEICRQTQEHPFPDEHLLKLTNSGILNGRDISPNSDILLFTRSKGKKEKNIYFYNVYFCFLNFVFRSFQTPRTPERDALRARISEVVWCVRGKNAAKKKGKKEVTFDEIDACTQLDEQRRHQFYADLAEYRGVPSVRQAMARWLEENEARRQEEEMKRFIASL